LLAHEAQQIALPQEADLGRLLGLCSDASGCSSW
jgi:hypothetical protein